MRWGTVYASSGAQENLERVLVSVIVIALVEIATLALPTPAVGILLAGMLILTHKAALHSVPAWSGDTAGRTGRLNGTTLLSLWQTPVLIALYFGIWCCLSMLLVTTIGNITEDVGFPWASLLAKVIDIGFSVIMLCRIRQNERQVDWSLLWQIAFLLLALGLLSVSLVGPTRIAQTFVSASAVLVFMFTEYLLIRIAHHHTSYPLGTVVGAGFAAISLIGWAMRGAVAFYGALIEDARLVPVLLVAILFIIVFLLPARTPGMQPLTSEFAARHPTENNAIERRCKTIASEYGLAPRETEVLTLLALGRSIPRIAETLCLTENTVKTYRQRLYAKLGVHSKQELLDLVD